jgi:DNA-binding response OmpR family regulator
MDAKPGTRLDGHPVLVVEDEYFTAVDAARMLRDAGADVMGPCPDIDAANAIIARRRPDAAVLDINLGHGPSFELAQSLKERGIPFVFVSGYDAEIVPDQFDGVDRLIKPVDSWQLVAAVSRLVDAPT